MGVCGTRYADPAPAGRSGATPAIVTPSGIVNVNRSVSRKPNDR